eukprot:gene26123-biopygen2551
MKVSIEDISMDFGKVAWKAVINKVYGPVSANPKDKMIPSGQAPGPRRGHAMVCVDHSPGNSEACCGLDS